MPSLPTVAPATPPTAPGCKAGGDIIR
jgi:hypothetical protein